MNQDAAHATRDALSQLSWWMGASRGIATYNGQFMLKESQRWVDAHAADHRNAVCGFYLMEWKEFESFKALMDLVRSASGLTFKTIPTMPTPQKDDGNTPFTGVEILIDTTQPNLSEKLERANTILLSPLREHALQQAQQIIDRFRQREDRVKASDAPSYAQSLEELQAHFAELIDAAFRHPRKDTTWPGQKIENTLDQLACIDLQNDAVVAQCYRTRLYSTPLLTVLGGKPITITQTDVRNTMDAMGFPDPIRDLIKASHQHHR